MILFLQAMNVLQERSTWKLQTYCIIDICTRRLFKVQGQNLMTLLVLPSFKHCTNLEKGHLDPVSVREIDFYNLDHGKVK